MEACKGSMFHARSIADLGHEVRLVKGTDVKALRNVNHKNDLRDAAYIANLYFVPGIKYVYIKNRQKASLQFLQNEYKEPSGVAHSSRQSDPRRTRRVRMSRPKIFEVH